MNTQTATFGAGCFWGVEETFRNIEGVLETEVGYAGGDTDSPTYQQVCTGMTYHAEVVRVTFDAEVVSYDALLNAFWQLHDPTQLNRQGVDTGTQYRTVIFTHSPEQAAAAEASKIRVQPHFDRPIVTQILPSPTFWSAEEYHQKYLLKRGKGSCHI